MYLRCFVHYIFIYPTQFAEEICQGCQLSQAVSENMLAALLIWTKLLTKNHSVHKSVERGPGVNHRLYLFVLFLSPVPFDCLMPYLENNL